MNKQNYRTCIGGILFLIAALVSVATPMINHLIIALNADKYGLPAEILQSLRTDAISSTIITLVNSIPSVVLAVFLLLRKRDKSLVVISIIALVVTALNAGLTLLGTIIIFISGTTSRLPFYMLFMIPVDALFLILVLNTSKEPYGRFAKLWFLPGAAFCVYIFANVIYIFLYNRSLNPGIDATALLGIVAGVLLRNMPAAFLRCAGYFLAGHWLVNPYKKGYQSQQQAQYQPQYDEQTMQALNYYKWQYESGAITWEQYNAAIQPYLHK